MALDNQVNIYSVDTGNFYTNKERNLHNKNAKIRGERRAIAEQIKVLTQQLTKAGYREKELQKAAHEGSDNISINIIDGSYSKLCDYIELSRIKKLKTNAADALKDKLLLLLSNKTKAKEVINPDKHHNNICLPRVLNGNTPLIINRNTEARECMVLLPKKWNIFILLP